MTDARWDSERLRQRLIARVRKSGDCWLARPGSPNEYARVRINGILYGAHRVSYIVFRGPIPKSLLVCHTCDVRACINPDHLFLGTVQDNALDAKRKGRSTRLRGAERGAQVKLTDAQVRVIRSDARSQSVIAAEYGVDQSLISRIKSRKLWSHVA